MAVRDWLLGIHTIATLAMETNSKVTHILDHNNRSLDTVTVGQNTGNGFHS